MNNYLKLISGSDIRGNGEKDLNKTFLYKIAEVLSEFIKKSNRPQIVIGKDSRITGPQIESLLADYLSYKNIPVIQLVTEPKYKNVSTTPMVFAAMEYFKADFGIMITASHLPSNWNGLKIFYKEDILPKKILKELLTKASELADISEDIQRNNNFIIKENFMNIYSDTICNFIKKNINDQHNYDKPLSGMKILVDAGNGATGFFAEKIIAKLGADISDSLFLEPDGNFPNHIPNPELPEAIKSISDRIIKAKGDLGILFDTDGDRSSIVLPDGKPVNGNRMLALVAAMVLSEHPNTYIVTDSVTSDGLTEFIKSHNGIHCRYKRGYANVKTKMKELNEQATKCYVGGETSGHIMFTKNKYADDGSFTIAKLLIYQAKLKKEGLNFNFILKNLKEALESKVFRLKINLDDFKDYGLKIIEAVKQEAETQNYPIDTTEGVRISITEEDIQGWTLVRLSLHEPLIVVNMEADKKGGTAKIIKLLQRIFKEFEHLDLTNFK